MGRRVKLKPFASSPEDLIDLKERLESTYTQVHCGDPQRTSEGDYYMKITIIVGDWEDEPATIKQLLALLGMGISFDDELTKGEASRIIRDQRNRRAIG